MSGNKGDRLLRAHREHVRQNREEASRGIVKIEAAFTLDCEAPALNLDAWDLVRSATTSALHALVGRGCANVRVDIVGAFADGKRVKFAPTKGAS
jgi:hypothetical protein